MCVKVVEVNMEIFSLLEEDMVDIDALKHFTWFMLDTWL